MFSLANITVLKRKEGEKVKNTHEKLQNYWAYNKKKVVKE